ncbi:HTH-type transcriptional regulator MalT [Marinobacterium nitratireducens]|uniref:HTH-type transcriptional regulator MalT n=1 Tax=Marinobacterium nitratireducens TaxID=518897 RepID=A0A917ZQH0_9GAMM|nr:HTH-type transcriptional regulator MalT [Marinobacterium nitratireducens]GGO87373.1 HTH-type transcriptional regulator MalT [Marinobacterium nitratireducens]
MTTDIAVQLKTARKLRCPPLPNDSLERPRLAERLQEPLEGRLLLVRAPAGYGKTTLINSWSQRRELDTLWYNLDATDNQAEAFMRYLGDGMRERLDLTPAPEPVATDACAMMIELLNALPEQHEPLLLVLDDYHHIDDPRIDAAIRLLLRHLPPYLNVAVLSRSQPQFGVAQLRVQRRLIEIDSGELAFDSDETAALLERELPFEVSREQVERLARRTEGWASALQLACLNGQTPALLDAFIDALKDGQPHVLDYIAEEVLAPLPETPRRFMLDTGILERFDSGLASRVSGNDDAPALLAQLEREGLFLRPCDDAPGWYRYQSLVARSLQLLLQRQSPRETSERHLRACDAWLDLGAPIRALHHALAARDESRLLALLLRYGRQLFDEGQLALLQQCLQRLSPASVHRQPLLTLLSAWVAQSQHHFEEAESWLQRAEETLKPIYNEDEWQTLQGDFSAIRAQMAMNVGATDEAITLAETALSLNPELMRRSRTTALSVLGEAHFVRGNLDEAQRRMGDTEQQARAQDSSQLVLWTLIQQSELAIARGHLQQAYNLQERAFSYAESQRLPANPMLEFLHRIRGQILWEWHHLEAAEQCALQGIEILEPQGERWLLQCYTLLAKVAHSQGRQSLCADYIQRMQKLLARWDYHLDWVANAQAMLITYWEETSDRDNLARWVDTAPVQGALTNHFGQCNARNRARALLALERYDAAAGLLNDCLTNAERCGLIMDQNRNHLYLALLHWQQQQREAALGHLHRALTLATTTGVISSFLRLGKPLIVMLKATLAERDLSDLERQRAERLIGLSQQQRQFSRAIRITLDEAIIQDIINRPDVPELIRTSPLTRREWQVLSLIHGGLPNEQIASQLDVAPTTIKTHIRSLYQKLGVASRAEAIDLATDLLSKIQGE